MISDIDIKESLFPRVNIARITLESSKDDKLISNLQFVLSDFVENDDISNWLENNNALKHLNILVLQSADLELSNKILEKDIIESIGNKIIDLSESASGLQNDRVTNAVKQILQQNSISQDKLSLVTGKIVSFLQAINDVNNIRQFTEIVTQDDGSRTINLFLDTTFDKSLNFPEDPEHLSYIFLLYYDYTSLLADTQVFQYNSGLQDITIPLMYFVKNENVISNNNVKNTSVVFLTEQNQIWTGLVHEKIITNPQSGQTEIIYRSGFNETRTSIDLTKIEVQNNKILDYRNLKRITEFNKLDINIQNLLLENVKIQQQETAILQQDISFMSDSFVSVDSVGNVAFTFFIDSKKLFIKNSERGIVLSKLNTPESKRLIERLYSYGTIETITLKCKRTDLDDSLSIESQNYEIVALLSGEKLDKAYKNISFNMDSPTSQLLCCSIVDTIPKTIGNYRYMVEVEYSDRASETIYGFINNLRQEQKLLKEYYETAILPNNFNENTNRFTTQFINTNNINVSFTQLADILNKFFEITRINGISLNQILDSYLRPINATPDSILAVIELYNATINTLSSIITSTQTVDSSLNEKGNGFELQQNIRSISKVIKLQKEFKKTINLTNAYKLEYLNHRKSASIANYSNLGFSYKIAKTDLISRKLDLSSKFNTRINEEEQKEEVFNKLYKIIGNDANLIIKKNLRLDVLPGNLTIQNKADLNDTLFSLLNPTISSKDKNTHFIIDDSYKPNLFWKIHPNNASVRNTARIDFFRIYELFPNSSILSSDIVSLPNQIKQLILVRTNTPEDVIDDAKIRIKYEMLKQVKVLKGFVFNQQNAIYSLGEPIWDIMNATSQPANTLLFCSLVDYNTSLYSFNTALNELSTNAFFFLSFSDTHQSGQIIDGATQVSIYEYESRCQKEIESYFGDTTSVLINLKGKIINKNDSLENNKYGYLSPIGVYFDKNYKLFDPTILTIGDIVNPVAVPSSITLQIIPPPRISPNILQAPPDFNATISTRINANSYLNLSIYSRNEIAGQERVVQERIIRERPIR